MRLQAGMSEPSLDLRALEIFVAVCQTGSMSAAARQLELTQPAVSQAIAELERKTGVALFDRNVRPLAVTVAGGVLRQRASVLVAEAREIPALLREAQHGKVPSIRVGLVDSLSRLLSVPLATFLSSRASEVAILSGLTATHASDLLTRRIDIFLGVDDLEDVNGLERWSIATEPYLLLLPSGTKRPGTLNQLKALAANLPFIRFSARSQTGVQIDRHLRRLGVELPRTLEFDNPYAVAACVALGQGFAISTPLCMAEAKLPKGACVAVAMPGPQIQRTLTLVARHRELGGLPRELCAIAQRALPPHGLK
jgi:DNA-binding transcriptional LysR family regulator